MEYTEQDARKIYAEYLDEEGATGIAETIRNGGVFAEFDNVAIRVIQYTMNIQERHNGN